MTEFTPSKYNRETFDKIPEEKRTRILSVAIAEFANRGFNNANTNIIAKKAGISVGSLYKYFDTKEDFFLTAVGYGIHQLEKTLEEVLNDDNDLFGKIESILRIIQKHSRENQDIVRLYNEITAEGNSDLIRGLSSELESISAKVYTSLIAEAKKSGVVGKEVDEKIFAFCIDNLFMILQFSYATEYYKERMSIYLGKDMDDDEKIVRGILSFIRRALERG
ncbi:TetR/AcrR family transcriptional regulator [Leptospira langatensis]|uniref:TetR/AcrR family transcriptional regulator n=1 Tax=Leptospira langatensis TaxID=2484983 RepID=A0A5F1ZUI9_9LEPT|nr:TetR/AcrR family transcriptional regulator [Leptospira langatensis]TGJ98784.1 TetR/AcrR family transcriptional regulator [Leptospira langatensis]TGL40649.1 TetR/AcrR family transcriptional regulator [Leptospira langatensis]